MPSDVTLRELMTAEFANVQRQLDSLCQSVNRMVSHERFQALCDRVDSMEVNGDDREKRLNRVERTIWLMGIIIGLISPVFLAVVISFILKWLGG